MPSWHISPNNPNAEQGGGDLIAPHKEREDVLGPWVVFSAVDVAEHAGPLPLPHASVPYSDLLEIVREAAKIKPTTTGPQESVSDRVKAMHRDPTAEFSDLTEAEQETLALKWPGQLVGTLIGRVLVPGAPDPAPLPGAGEDDILADFEAEAPQQDPGPVKGTYVDVEDDDEVPVV